MCDLNLLWVSQDECCKTDGSLLRRCKRLAFRRRLSGVVFKPPYAADNGNMFVVSDREKTGARLRKVFSKELNVSEPMRKPRKASYDVKSR